MSDQTQKLQQFASAELGTPPVKPLVMLPGNGVQIRDTARNIYEQAAALNGLYFSNGFVVKTQLLNDSRLPSLTHLDPATARSEFEKFARFGKVSGKKAVECVLTESDAKAILLCDVAKAVLPNIRGLLSRPIAVLHDGKIEILKAGYNENVALMVNAGSVEEPETLADAVELVNSVIMDFSFQTESDMSRAIAALLTPALKLGGFIKGKTPIDIVEADEPQTGKGYLLKLRTDLYGETLVLVADQKGGVGSLDERFASALLQGRPFIEFDNFRGELNSQSLESFLTNPGLFSIRTPYAKEQYIDGSVYLVSISSNGLVTTEDLAHRSSFVRLIKEPDRVLTEVRGHTIDELIQTHQQKYMGAIVKVIRHWFDQGMPKTDEKRHAFREWAQKLDWIVQNVFELPPLMDGQEQVKQRAQNPALSFIRLVAIQIEKAGRLGVELSAQDVAEICEASGTEIPGLNKKGVEGYAEIQSAQRIGQLFGQAFKLENNVAVNQYQITRTERLKTVFGSGHTYSGKRYVFDHIAEETAGGQGADSAFNEPLGD